MNLELYTELRQEIETRLNPLNDKLNSFKRLDSGLVEITAEYKEVKSKFDLVFNELQTLNKFTNNKIKIQYSRINRGW